jgi:type II secretory pathway predicted ATPase ExeA
MRKFVDLYRGFQIFLKPVPYNERVAQIEIHYSHVLTQQRRHEITKTKRKAVAVVQDAADAEDSFALEALKRFRRGELSEAALLEIMKLPK